MRFVNLYDKYVHIDGRFKLHRFINLIASGITIPIIIGDLKDDLSSWKFGHTRNIILIIPINKSTFYAYYFSIVSLKYTIARKKFALDYFIQQLSEEMRRYAVIHANKNLIGVFTGTKNVIFPTRLTDQLFHFSITYPNRGELSWLLDEFIERFENLTGNTIPMTTKK